MNELKREYLKHCNETVPDKRCDPSYTKWLESELCEARKEILENWHRFITDGVMCVYCGREHPMLASMNTLPMMRGAMSEIKHASTCIVLKYQNDGV